ncbi:phosphate ABC transporter permease PtsA [Alteromonas aestuariivivens]|uniref:Phosphate transport system permease protein PstA n=1 Tax=Alteromonas aestuariivivens TaxID=1938339 RepID=A0A3D8MCA7_9ALTE|nr:phosphate ABC transporter permease PstA [Alteromonas aestuariivivens]RDV28148.1 phosphate ABC transporter permease PtsA [Alteromonas aestuariivivens]
MSRFSPSHWFSSVQKQSFAISFSAFMALLLTIALGCLLLIIVSRGATYFWPATIFKGEFRLSDESAPVKAYMQIRNEFSRSGSEVIWFKYSNRDFPYGNQAMLEATQISGLQAADDGALITLTDGRTVLAEPLSLQSAEREERALEDYSLMQEEVQRITNQIEVIRTERLSDIHQQLSELDMRNVAADAPARIRLSRDFNKWQGLISELEIQRNQYRLTVAFADGERFDLALGDIDEIVRSGRLSYWQKWQATLTAIGRFLTEAPKQANTAGGVFPALFGTVLMVFVMTLIVTPFGVMAAVYLSEYAPNNALTSVIRISVSNMAGVPSIVYGVFGLGFFVYAVGGNIDTLFFSHKLPAPTMGTPGLFWASLTMAILTLPVVIVATEEGLRRVPEGLKAGSYALGATKAETVMRTILPIASPGIMTGVILAIARAAGEVAPLMLVGAVKFAPNLPIDGEFPYLHLDRQFMHLGVLIYDGAFHSQTDVKGSSMMFATCLLLLLVVFILNLLAVVMRMRLRKKYQQG